MSKSIRKPEHVTRNRIVALFKNQLKYISLGNLEDKHGNSNIQSGLWLQYLLEQRCDWCDVKTKGLNDFQTAEIKKKLGSCNVEARRIWLNSLPVCYEDWR